MSEHLRRQWREARTPGPSEQYLDQVTKMMATGPLNGRKYRSPMEAIRDRGKPWRNIAPALRSDIKRGPMGNCFGNALNAVMADRSLIYVEGYAHSKFFPMAHAWVVDGNGTVYDPTWPEPAEDYFGIAFDTRWLMEYVSNSGYTSVFGTEFIHDGLIELLTKGIPDSAMNTTGSRTADRSRGIAYDQAWSANQPEFWVVGNAAPMIGGDWQGHVTLARRSMSYADALNPTAFVSALMSEAQQKVRSGDTFARGGQEVTTLYLVVRGRGREGMNSGGASWVVGEAPASGGQLRPTRVTIQGDYGRAASANPRMLQALTYAQGEDARKWIGENIAGVVTDESMFDAVPQKVTVYRGISLQPGADPWSSVNDNGGVGSSWTIDPDTARAIAERGRAGFSSGGQVMGDTYSVAKDKPYVPTVLRAEVTLLPPEQNGPAPYRPWTIDYASEAEIDIPRGTEIVLNGYAQAEMQVRRPDPSNPDYFNLVTWRWPSGWRGGNVKRTAVRR